MASNPASRSKVPKLCPRCGAFYQDLSSQTCPQCFARLDILSDDDAIALIAEQEKRAGDPEILKLKEIDDEKFREQSFGACFSVVLIMLATAIIAGVMILIATHKKPGQIQRESPTKSVIASEQASGLPPDFDSIVPLRLLRSIRSNQDVDQTLPETKIAIYHAVYTSDDQVFALKSRDATAANISTLTFAASFAAKQHVPQYLQQEVRTPLAQYIVIGPQASSVSADVRALASQH